MTHFLKATFIYLRSFCLKILAIYRASIQDYVYNQEQIITTKVLETVQDFCVSWA
jgi:hypothetical protein